MMNIVIEENPAYDCLDMLIAAISKYIKCEYRLMFIDAWRFLYNSNQEWESLGDKIALYSLKWAYLHKYHGLDTNIVIKNTLSEKIDFIRDQIKQDKPVVIKMDIYYCHWIIRSYQVRHSDHFCIVTDMDDENIYCIDSYVINKKVALPYKDFAEGNSLFLTFEQTQQVKKVDWKSLIKKELNCINKYNMIDCIIEFSRDVKKNFDVKKEIEPYKDMISVSPIISKLGEVYRNRRRFALSLMCLMEQYEINDLKFIIDRLIYVSNVWSMVYGMLIKANYIDNSSDYVDKVAKKIEEVASFEKEIIDELYKILDDEPIKPFVPYTHYKKYEFSKYQYLDITSYFNNNALGYIENQTYYPNVIGDDRFLVVNENLEIDILEIENMKFRLPEYVNETCDNIECYSQVLNIDQIDETSYDSIFILGCCDIGSHSNDIIINYNDGTKEKKVLYLTSWLSESPRFNDLVAWVGEGAVIKDNKIKCYDFDVHIYANTIAVDSSKIIKSIELPYCPNMHIFSITLAKKNE
ncbi:hypothetical protein [Vallitalea maricola]|uniref:Uncharacterized protein n=1 Tax=Vallitalea maricola TaxID=3074433 RepID=A0ACB5UFB9_9FIRM|nr:hypothetical protein AN2V17_08680 [Vallitalea sp. AN17-2]